MKTLCLCRQTLGITMAVAMLASCSKSSATKSAMKLTTDGPNPTPPYVAMEYDKPGHPSMTPEQMRTIREMLAKVKPCQRPLLRYVLDDEVTLFFAVPPGQGARILGSPGLFYLPGTGGEVPIQENGPEAEARAKQGVQWDIDHQPCPRPT
jgi:hypothetical protein